MIDVVGGSQVPVFLDRLNDNGRYVAVGVVGGQPPAPFGSGTVPGADRRAVRSSQFDDAALGDLRTVVHEVLPLRQTALAHHAVDAGTVFEALYASLLVRA